MNSIRHYRKKAGLTQGQLAAACGFGGQSTICNYENGLRSPGFEEARKICAALRRYGVRVSIDKLMEAQQAA